jgi:hypothetical protein
VARCDNPERKEAMCVMRAQGVLPDDEEEGEDGTRKMREFKLSKARRRKVGSDEEKC